MSRVRRPAVAGSFYPAEAVACAAAVDHYLAQATPAAGPPPKALIAPHAGFIYSGPVAATAYSALARGPLPTRVLILGPAHTVALRTMAVTTADEWATPLGNVMVDSELRRMCLECAGTVEDERPHASEHSLEVQLPFLQRILGDFTFLPIVVGAVPAGLVADLLAVAWGYEDTLVVISTDLSHYHDHTTATRLDRQTAASILLATDDAIDPEAACGAYPLKGMLRHAAIRGLTIEQLDLRTSADTAGNHGRVVGYGAFALSEPAVA